jgi:hypothetical protein
VCVLPRNFFCIQTTAPLWTDPETHLTLRITSVGVVSTEWHEHSLVLQARALRDKTLNIGVAPFRAHSIYPHTAQTTCVACEWYLCICRGRATGWLVGGSSPNRGWEFLSSPPRPDRLWGPPSLLPNGWPFIYIQCAGEGCVELHFHSANTPSWRGAQLKSTGPNLPSPFISVHVATAHR